MSELPHPTHIESMTVERIRDVHSRIPGPWLERMASEYKEAGADACYICWMLAEIASLREQLVRVKRERLEDNEALQEEVSKREAAEAQVRELVAWPTRKPPGIKPAAVRVVGSGGGLWFADVFL